jgi:outer membrane protein
MGANRTGREARMSGSVDQQSRLAARHGRAAHVSVGFAGAAARAASVGGAILLAAWALVPAPVSRAQEVKAPDATRLSLREGPTQPASLAQSEQQGAQTDALPALQLVEPGSASQTGPPVTLTLADALERARRFDAQYLSAVTSARLADEDKVQARASLLPAVSATTQEIANTGNSVLPTGRFVTQDGVHVYRAWGVLRQDFTPNLVTLNGYRRASAAELVAHAQQEIAMRGLNVTVTQAYYALVVAQRKYATTQQTLEEARKFLTITRDRESGGEAAHSDVIKAQIQFNQQEAAFEDARLGMNDARLGLAVLTFPELNENFTVVDDLDEGPALPPFDEAQGLAMRNNPELKAALETLHAAELDVSAARYSFLPTLSLEVDYGIEANNFALRSKAAANVDSLEKANLAGSNLGDLITANLQFPVWDWGSLRSKLHQAEWRRRQARVEMTSAQRNLVSRLYSAYNEALVSRGQVDLLRHSADLASESARLTTLRYQAGDASALEVVDAQNTLAQARGAYDDGEARYRVALANLQTLTGSF